VTGPDEFTVRRPHKDELAAIVDLMNASTIDEVGVPDADMEELLRSWRKSTFDPGRDAWVVETSDGRLVGSVHVEVESAEGDLLIDGYTHPEFVGRGIGSRLSDLAERRAVEVATEQGIAVPVEVFRGAWSGSPGARFLEDRGYARTRSFIRMRIDMGSPPAEPVWPDGIRLEGFERGRDEALFWEALEEAFQDHWRWAPSPLDEWVKQTIEDDDDYDGALWFRAMDGDRVAGAVIGRPRTAEDPTSGWIGDLAVRRPWRRRGIALALLQHELGVLYRRGLRAAMLGVDSESQTGATHLYERAGMREYRRIDVYLKAFG
jgi:GNAT superfamily N-acetyltransferase